MKHAIAAAMAFGVLAAAATTRGSAAEITLVENGQNPAAIYATGGKGSPEQKAGAALASYLGRISGAKFVVQPPSTNNVAQGGIWVGAADPAATAGLAKDDFRIEVKGNRLLIVGGSPAATLCAAYAFLEEFAGCRWWSRNEEDVPQQPTIRIPETNIVRRSPFEIHKVWNLEAQSAESNFLYKARTGGAVSFSGGHTMYPLLTPYATNHPDIYPMNAAGERKANKLHFCYMAPGIAQALADALSKEVEAHHGDVTNVIYFAGMGDWYGGMCQCPECKKIYAEETWTDPDGRKKPGYTATLLRMMNETAGILDKKYPGIRIGTFAYMSLEAPPAKTAPARNVVIRVPRLRHCTVHPAATCASNRSYLRNIERWCQVATNRVYIWEYGASFKNFLTPFPCLYSMADNLRLYHKLGIRGVEIQGNYVSTGGDLAVLKNYVWRKLMWDPDLAPRPLVQEFCKGYYGPAAEPVMAYVEALEQSVRPVTNGTCADEFAGFKYLTPDVLKRMRVARENAIASAAGQEPYLQRVKEATAGMEALALWKPGPLEERDGKLIRSDIGEYTYPRARELVNDIRGSANNEWSSGRAAQMGFLAMHGGPLVTFTHEDVVVKFAPVLNGRVWQLLYRGQPLLYVPDAAREKKASPMQAGSYENLGTRMMEIAGEAASNHVTIEGDAGISLWGGSTKQKIWKRVGMNEDGSIWMTGTFQRVSTAPEYEKKAAVICTVYSIGKDATGLKVERLTTNGQWEAMAIPPATNALPAVTLNGLRVTLPSRGCLVEDLYPAPAEKTGQVLLDPKKHTLTVQVSTAPVAAPLKKGEAVFFGRKLSVLALPAGAALRPAATE